MSIYIISVMHSMYAYMSICIYIQTYVLGLEEHNNQKSIILGGLSNITMTL